MTNEIPQSIYDLTPTEREAYWRALMQVQSADVDQRQIGQRTIDEITGIHKNRVDKLSSKPQNHEDEFFNRINLNPNSYISLNELKLDKKENKKVQDQYMQAYAEAIHSGYSPAEAAQYAAAVLQTESDDPAIRNRGWTNLDIICTLHEASLPENQDCELLQILREINPNEPRN